MLRVEGFVAPPLRRPVRLVSVIGHTGFGGELDEGANEPLPRGTPSR
jgi:hypothetical protein